MTNQELKPIITDDISDKVSNMSYDELLTYHESINALIKKDELKLLKLQFIEGYRSLSYNQLTKKLDYTEEQIKSFYPVSKQVLDTKKTQETGTAQFKTVTKYHFKEPVPTLDYETFIKIELPELYNEYKELDETLNKKVDEMSNNPSFELHKDIMSLSKKIDTFIKNNVPADIKKEYRMLKKDLKDESKFDYIKKFGKVEFSIMLNELKLKFIEQEQLAKRPKRVESDYSKKLDWYKERYQ